MPTKIRQVSDPDMNLLKLDIVSYSFHVKNSTAGDVIFPPSDYILSRLDKKIKRNTSYVMKT